MSAKPNLTIDAQRLWGSLMETAAFGGTPKGGIRRLAASEEDRQVRSWFGSACEALGCRVAVDRCGNMFAIRPGIRADLAPIAMGSHLDTQPTGGKFDGVLGVLGALEVLRTLADMQFETNAPLMVVNWTNEEGSRFSPAMLCSGTYAGVFDEQTALSARDRDGVSLADALAAIGFAGPEAPGAVSFQAYFELHIEQGPILEAERTMIGSVTGVQGMRWYDARVTGQDAHTGATPMHLRQDALLGAARMIEAVNEIGRAHGPGVASVGCIECRPNSRNVVPGEVVFTIDLRHPDDLALDRMETAFGTRLSGIAADLGLALETKRIWHAPAVTFARDLVDCVRRGAAQAGYESRDITSGAGHDAAYIARIVPATMIFVPCKDGISHNEAEWTSPEACAAGTQVLLNAVLEYDRRFG
jgi:N-carbamoyl-L-amino-acid hydrolase